MENERLKNIGITNDDIEWVESLLNLSFDEERREVIKNLDSVDIQAFPGSGKTTCLIAKLAILAKKWPYSHSGICVISHTNVARDEIEERLGNTEIGRRLLSYPHFIGTVHSFFDTFVALPHIRSQGIKINIIDTELVKKMRWYHLNRGTRTYFEKNHEDYHLCGYIDKDDSIAWKNGGPTRQELLKCISDSQKNGYFTFDEILFVSQKVLTDNPFLSNDIGHRFPLLFIDEAQDTNSIQWDLLKKALVFCFAT